MHPSSFSKETGKFKNLNHPDRLLARFFFLVLFVLPFASFAQIFQGKVIGVTDGDTIKILHNKQQLKIRLAEIDTPEKGQPYGNKAKQALSDLVFGKKVRVVKQDVDRYGRIVGRVYLGDLDVNAEMVRLGYAWVYRKYAKDKTLYELEKQAQAERQGLWAVPDFQRIPPWEWRKRQRAKLPTKQDASFQCGAKRYCREMASCQEAMFYLKKCGLTRLDGDGDGVPCETICR